MEQIGREKRTPLSNAERQRRWREKKKQANLEEFMRTEAERKRNSYIPVDSLTSTAKKKRREEGRKRSKKWYDNNKKDSNKKHKCQGEFNPGSQRLIVRLPQLKTPTTGLRKRYSRSLRKAHRDNVEIKAKNEELQRSNKRLQKRLERMRKEMMKKNKADESSIIESSEETNSHVEHEEIEEQIFPDEATPKSKTSREMQQLNLQRDTVGTPKRIKKKLKFIEKKLLLANTLTTEVKETLVKKKKKKNQMAWKGISGRYRCTTLISKALGICRKKVRKLGEARRFKCKKELRDSVTEFLQREDNSTTMPGKRDTKTESSEKTQKHILSDYMKNLYEKYRFENPEKKISKSQFYALRPSHVVLANFASRKTCLCSRHQNMALKLRALIAKGVKCSKNPDECIKDKDTIIQQIRDLEVTEISYKHWKKVQEGDKFRHKEVVETKGKGEFLDEFLEQFQDFEDHVGRVKHQYQELRKLRQNLPMNEAVVWMDFAENYMCSSVEEVQSAYWNAAMVSLHTMVVYYRPKEDEKAVQSYVAISDVLSHNAVSVYAVLLKLIPHLKALVPNLTTVHYLTDSPTSQYRNKTIFRLISTHKDEFGITARWNYLESGHGKGPCDGLGASVKRGADDVVKHGKASIQNADDFYKWAEKAMEDGSRVKYFLYNQDDYDNAQAYLQSLPPARPVTGTFKVHYVVSCRPMEIYTRHISCYCEQCTEDVTSTTCGGYAKQSLVAKERNFRKGRNEEQQLELENAQNQTIKSDAQETRHAQEESGIIHTKDAQGSSHEVQTEDSHIANNIAETDNATETLQMDNTQVEMNNVNASHKEQQEDTHDKNMHSGMEVNIGDWVAGLYDHKWYIGKILDVDDVDIHVDFLEKTGKCSNSFKYPNKPDQIWIDRNDILHILTTPPALVGSRRKVLKISEFDYDFIEEKYECLK